MRIAAGGMGEVWAGRLRREHGFQKLFAIKVLRPELSPDPDFVRMFLDEAALSARIKHPNVVPVVDLGEKDGTLFHVMEWVSGEPLSSVLRAVRGRPAPVLVAARIAYQVCAALDAAHELRDDLGNPLELVHYDVSPENVLITSEGLVRLVDFGVAKFEGDRVSERPRDSRGGPARDSRGGPARDSRGGPARAPGEAAGETGAISLRGKAPYMAPEHILGQPCDRRADLFAVGVLLYELLSGAHPFQAEDDELTMSQIASERPAAPVSSRVGAGRRGLSGRLSSAPPPPQIPPALDRLVAEALAKSPTARTATAAQLMRSLEEAVPGAALTSNDALVAAWVGSVLGSTFQLRTQQLRAALESLEPVDDLSEVTAAVPRPPPSWVQAAWALGAAVVGCALAGIAAVGDSPVSPAVLAVTASAPPAGALATCAPEPSAPHPPSATGTASAAHPPPRPPAAPASTSPPLPRARLVR